MGGSVGTAAGVKRRRRGGLALVAVLGMGRAGERRSSGASAPERASDMAGARPRSARVRARADAGGGPPDEARAAVQHLRSTFALLQDLLALVVASRVPGIAIVAAE